MVMLEWQAAGEEGGREEQDKRKEGQGEQDRWEIKTLGQIVICLISLKLFKRKRL